MPWQLELSDFSPLFVFVCGFFFCFFFVQGDNNLIPDVLQYSPFLPTVGEQILELIEHCFSPVLVDFCWDVINAR